MEFICRPDFPVVETKAGKVRGYKMDGLYTFKGIRYATSKRFHQPEPVAPWEGIKDATQYGDTSPYMEKKVNGFGDIRINHRYWPQDEECQYLNVWTDTINDETVKKPVFFWIHGGGFDTGSSVELVCYEGTGIAGTHEAVVVSINHRLNIQGYLDLSDYGEDYKYSATAGMADVVVALQWVHDNIAKFGGDPDNVTIFGQSGGGAKVSTLLQIPAADGLFHKAIIMSGCIRRNNTGARTAELGKLAAARLVERLGLTKETIAEIETIPFEKLRDTYNEVHAELVREGKASRGFGPVANGYFVGDGETYGWTEHARSLPVMIGSTLGEFPVPDFPGRDFATREEKIKALSVRFGENTAKIADMFEKSYPDHDLMDMWFLDTAFRGGSIANLDTFTADANAKAYSYVFAYDFPLNEDEPAWHCSDLPYCFHNIDLVPVAHEGEVSEKLQDQIFGAWLAFAKTGNPSCEAIPEWRPYGEAHQSMVFDKQCRLTEKDYDLDLQNLAFVSMPSRY